MKTIVFATAASWLALTVPVFAQSYHAYPTHRHYVRHSLYGGFHTRAEHHARRYGGGDVYVRRDESRYGSGDVYVREGRAAAPIVPVPGFAWRPEAEQEGVGADLVGPGSSGENPTGQYDVSR